MSSEDNFELKVINYQRVRNADMTFIPGLNIICGRTNSGKSAILRAIETAVYNIARESHVTIGETKSAVGIKYKGHEIVWRRDKNSASQVSYRIDGKIYNKVGRGQPELVAEALNISEIEVNGRKFRVNFGKQMSFPFLLDSTPSEFFKFIVQSGEEENVTDVLDTMKKDFMEMKNNIKTYESTANSLGQSYQTEAKAYNELKPSLSYAKQILDIDSKVQEYKLLEQQIETLKKSKEVIDTLSSDYNKYKSLLDNMNTSIGVIAVKMGEYNFINDNVVRLKEQEELLKSSEEQIKLDREFFDKTSDYSEYRNRLNKIDLVIGKKNSIISAIAQAKHYHDVVDVESVNVMKYRESLEQIDEVISYIEKNLGELNSLIPEYNTLKEQSLDVFRKQKAVEDLENKVLATKKMAKDYEDELSQFGYCPHCLSPLDEHGRSICADGSNGK